MQDTERNTIERSSRNGLFLPTGEPTEDPVITEHERRLELVEQMAEGHHEPVTSPGQRSLTIWDGSQDLDKSST